MSTTVDAHAEDSHAAPATVPATSPRRTALILNALFGVRVVLSAGLYAFIAQRFGTSAELDGYWIAVNPSMALINVTEAAGVGAAINFSTGLAHAPKGDRRSAIAGFVLTWLLITALLAGCMALFAGPIIDLLGPGLGVAQRSSVVRLLMIASLATFAGPASVLVAVGLLRSTGRFVPAALVSIIPVLAQVLVLAGGASSVDALVIAMVGGYGLAAIYGIGLVQRIESPTWRLPTFRAQAEMFRHLPVLVIAELLIQVIFMRERALASFMSAGAVSALSLALRMVAVLASFISAGIEHTLAPAISRLHAAGDGASANQRSRRALLWTLGLALIPGALLVALRRPIVELAFGRGAFSDQSVDLTAAALVGYMGVYAWNSVGRVAVASTISQRRIGTCLVINSTALMIAFILGPLLSGRYGVTGLATSTSVACAVAAVAYAFVATRA